MGCWRMQKLWINADGGRWYSNAIGCDFRQICSIWKTGKIQKIRPKLLTKIRNDRQGPKSTWIDQKSAFRSIKKVRCKKPKFAESIKNQIKKMRRNFRVNDSKFLKCISLTHFTTYFTIVHKWTRFSKTFIFSTLIM